MKKFVFFLIGVIGLVAVARVVMLRYQDIQGEFSEVSGIVESWKDKAEGIPEDFTGLQGMFESWIGNVEGIPEDFADLQGMFESWMENVEIPSENLEDLQEKVTFWKEKAEEFTGDLSGQSGERFTIEDWEPKGSYDINTDNWFNGEETIMSGSQESMQLSLGQVTGLTLQAAGCNVEIVESEDADIYLAFENMKKVQAYQSEDDIVVKAVRDTELKQESTNSVLRLYLPVGFYFNEAEMELGAGSLKIENIHAGELKVSVEAGKLTAEALCAETLEATLGAGMILLEQTQVQDANLSVGAGSMVLNGQIHGNVDAECTVGGLKLNLQGDTTDFNYELQCMAGNIQIGDEDYSGMNEEKQIDNGAEKTMELDCVVGKLEVGFKAVP